MNVSLDPLFTNQLRQILQGREKRHQAATAMLQNIPRGGRSYLTITLALHADPTTYFSLLPRDMFITYMLLFLSRRLDTRRRARRTICSFDSWHFSCGFFDINGNQVIAANMRSFGNDGSAETFHTGDLSTDTFSHTPLSIMHCATVHHLYGDTVLAQSVGKCNILNMVTGVTCNVNNIFDSGSDYICTNNSGQLVILHARFSSSRALHPIEGTFTVNSYDIRNLSLTVDQLDGAAQRIKSYGRLILSEKMIAEKCRPKQILVDAHDNIHVLCSGTFSATFFIMTFDDYEEKWSTRQSSGNFYIGKILVDDMGNVAALSENGKQIIIFNKSLQPCCTFHVGNVEQFGMDPDGAIIMMDKKGIHRLEYPAAE